MTIIRFPGSTILPLSPHPVIMGALEEHQRNPFRRILIIGVHEDDSEFYASSESDGGLMLWDIERLRHELMKRADNA